MFTQSFLFTFWSADLLLTGAAAGALTVLVVSRKRARALFGLA